MLNEIFFELNFVTEGQMCYHSDTLGSGKWIIFWVLVSNFFVLCVVFFFEFFLRLVQRGSDFDFCAPARSVNERAICFSRALALLFLGIGSNGIFKDGRIVHGKQAKVGLGKDKSPAWI